ncbi:MAG: GTPase ObgE [Candidatus Peribacteraceae bacterium]|nr:GTPase ObgE [Candidatus Peribacteraceae bacterium]
MFIDEAIIDVTGGRGGDGCVAWRREKYVPNGGPDGGDGGRGGNIVLMADPNSDTLSNFASAKRFKAKNGDKGLGKSCNGKGAEDTILSVPPGTIVTRFDPDNIDAPGELLADLRVNGQTVVVARGGKGGFGNAHFKSSIRQAPDFAELGEPGHTQHVKLELKLVADVGIIGFPSVGKSSLIATVSSAKPKIAAYEFTTLVPNLGVVKVFDREFVMCDVPGIIEGASEGKGLGDQFLKHIERCGILVHMLDINRPDIVEDYKTIRNELKAYSPALAKKKEIVVLNKIDLVAGDAKPFIDELKKAKIKVSAAISTSTTQGIQDLMKLLLPLVLKAKEQRELEYTEQASGDTLPVLRPHLESDLMGVYRIERKDKRIIIKGRRLEQFTSMTNFGSTSAVNRFVDVVERTGLLKAINKVRTDGEKVYIGKTRVDEQLF